MRRLGSSRFDQSRQSRKIECVRQLPHNRRNTLNTKHHQANKFRRLTHEPIETYVSTTAQLGTARIPPLPRHTLHPPPSAVSPEVSVHGHAHVHAASHNFPDCFPRGGVGAIVTPRPEQGDGYTNAPAALAKSPHRIRAIVGMVWFAMHAAPLAPYVG